MGFILRDNGDRPLGIRFSDISVRGLGDCGSVSCHGYSCFLHEHGLGNSIFLKRSALFHFREREGARYVPVGAIVGAVDCSAKRLCSQVAGSLIRLVRALEFELLLLILPRCLRLSLLELFLC
jgi:hypothetical protein